MPRSLRQTVLLLIPLLLVSASLHAQEEPTYREPMLIWVDMTTLWEGVERIERAGEYTVETMSEIEALAVSLGELLYELQRSINQNPVPQSWEKARIRKITTGITFLSQELGKLQSAAYSQIPIYMPTPIGMTRLRLWALQLRFPDGYLAPLLPRPPEAMPNDPNAPE
jgi:hypothetical protein